MAYEIISQNNTVTTLADENGNVITVPARVTLATSTDYTITKVNNNTVDLVDGNGKVIRGVPACVVLAGEGGGGDVDYSKVVRKADVIPTASASNAGQIYLYTGATNANYTTNYIYKNVKSATYTGTVSFEAATLSGTTVTCSGDNFATFLTEAGADPTPIVSGTMTYEADATGWRLVGKDSDGNTVTTFLEYVEDYQDAGFVFTGTPQDSDVIAFTCSVTEASATYAWTRIDVQPAPESLPDQTGQSGKFLTTDGTDASWSDKPLTNRATDTNSIAIGKQSSANNVSCSLGYQASATGSNSTAIGSFAGASQTFGVAIGERAKSTAQGAVQISAMSGGATNADANTFKVANANGNFEIMSADGTVPTDRFTTAPSADGTYVPTLTISSGVATRSWGSGGGGGGSYTAGTGIDITSSTISVISPVVEYASQSTTPVVQGQYSLAIGDGAQVQQLYGMGGEKCVAIGNNAIAYGGSWSVAVGADTNAAGSSAVAVGYHTTAADNGVAVGYNLKSRQGGIIIGSSNGTETSGTKYAFDIVLREYEPLYGIDRTEHYTMCDIDGHIPPERLGTGYDATKTQTLKNVQGVLTWVDD